MNRISLLAVFLMIVLPTLAQGESIVPEDMYGKWRFMAGIEYDIGETSIKSVIEGRTIYEEYSITSIRDGVITLKVFGANPHKYEYTTILQLSADKNVLGMGATKSDLSRFLKVEFIKDVAILCKKIRADGTVRPGPIEAFWKDPEGHEFEILSESEVIDPLPGKEVQVSSGTSFRWAQASGEIDVSISEYNHDFAGLLANLISLNYAATRNQSPGRNEDAKWEIKQRVGHFIFRRSGRYYSFFGEKYGSFSLFGKNVTLPLENVQFSIATQFDPVSNRDIVLVMFEGSQDVVDWIYDCGISNADFFNTSTNVHEGFYRLLEFFVAHSYDDPNLTMQLGGKQQTLKSYLDASKNQEAPPFVVVSGHSLGGALATLFGAFLVEEGLDPDSLAVYTFGAPPVGKRDFVKRYSAMHAFDVKNTKDFVPYSTSFCGGFSSSGQTVAFSDTGPSSIDFSRIHASAGGTSIVDCKMALEGAAVTSILDSLFGTTIFDFSATHNLYNVYIRDFYSSEEPKSSPAGLLENKRKFGEPMTKSDPSFGNKL